MTDRPLPTVLVIGGGVTGLAAAHALAKSGRARIRLLERGARTGGIVSTDRSEGRVLERGPDCFISNKPWALALAKELGLEPELRSTTTGHRRSFVLRDRRFHPIPEGFHLMAPTLVKPFLASGLVSWPGKIRAGLEVLLPRRPKDDESLESFVRRRLGGELFERLVEPLVAGIYTADARELSLRATFPQFLDLERDHGSILRGLWARRGAEDAPAARAASGPRYGLFLTFKDGVQTFTDAIAASLPPGTLELGAEATSVRRAAPGGFEVVVRRGESTETLAAAAVLVALPAPAAARVLAPLDADLAAKLGAIPYASAATLNLVFRREQVRHALDAMGFVVPSRERRFLLACSFSTTKFDGRAREGEVLLRAFLGGQGHREDVELPEGEIVRRALEELRDLLGIEGEPVRTLATVWPGAMPQYVLGHLDRVAAIEASAGRIPGLALAGNAYRGVGIPDCVRSAEAATARLLEGLPAGT